MNVKIAPHGAIFNAAFETAHTRGCRANQTAASAIACTFADLIKPSIILASALAIHSVEGRHASALNTLLGQPITPDGAFAKPADVKTVLKSVEPFIVS